MQKISLKVCDQQKGEAQLRNWSNGEYTHIINMAKEPNGFQGLCWNLPNIPQLMHSIYPDALFLLTVRSNADEWYNSLKRFVAVANKFNIGGCGVDEVHKIIYNATLNEADKLKKHYNDYNETMRNYFITNKANFLELNLADKDSSKKLCDFVGIEFTEVGHFNKTA